MSILGSDHDDGEPVRLRFTADASHLQGSMRAGQLRAGQIADGPVTTTRYRTAHRIRTRTLARLALVCSAVSVLLSLGAILTAAYATTGDPGPDGTAAALIIGLVWGAALVGLGVAAWRRYHVPEHRDHPHATWWDERR